MEGHLLYSKSPNFNVHLFLKKKKKIFPVTSRLVLDQRIGHNNLAKVTHKNGPSHSLRW